MEDLNVKTKGSSGGAAIFMIGVAILVFSAIPVHGQSPNLRDARQGYSMRLCLSNRGAMGYFGYTVPPAPCSSRGLEYPVGDTTIEHLVAGGLWVGGILDTSQGGAASPVPLVTTAFEGGAGPNYEFFPETSAADSIWTVQGRGVPRPASWESYWGDLIPRVSFSDNDHYCMYDDSHVSVNGHVPLHVRVTQSSYSWVSPYADGIDIVECKIVNTGTRIIDSAYIGFYMEGPTMACYTSASPTFGFGRFPDIRTGFLYYRLGDATPMTGIRLLATSPLTGDPRWTLRWLTGTSHPPTDRFKYYLLSSGRVDTNFQSNFSSGSTIRCVFSIGPFTLHSLAQDTTTIVYALLAADTLSTMRVRAERAEQIYRSNGETAVTEEGRATPESVELIQNYPNPFNPSTTIKYDLPKDSRVSLKIFDILGREVATLVNGEEKAGNKSAVWNATGFSSGVYIYRLEAGNFVSLKKLLLLK
jgi:hypothetical protein